MHLTAWLRRRRMRTRKPFGKAVPADALRITLCDTSERVVDGWLWAFRDSEDVEIVEGDLLQLEADAILSPANSFGDMSGGIDKVIDDHFAGAAQAAAMAAIRDTCYGELPVGQALVLPIAAGAKRFDHLVVAPTMRTPGSVARTLNAYLAFRGALVAVQIYNRANDNGKRIRTLAAPGLCTGVGGMDPGIAAEQMITAHRNITMGFWEKVVHPAMAPFPYGPRRE